MVDRVIIEGPDLDLTVERADQRPDPKRRRPPEYLPPAPADLVDIGDTIARGNPYWTNEANRDADENPDGLRPIDLARKWKCHRIQPQETAA